MLSHQYITTCNAGGFLSLIKDKVINPDKNATRS